MAACILDDCLGKLGVGLLTTYEPLQAQCVRCVVFAVCKPLARLRSDRYISKTFGNLDASDTYNQMEEWLSRVMIFHIVHNMGILSYAVAQQMAQRVRPPCPLRPRPACALCTTLCATLSRKDGTG